MELVKGGVIIIFFILSCNASDNDLKIIAALTYLHTSMTNLCLS